MIHLGAQNNGKKHILSALMFRDRIHFWKKSDQKKSLLSPLNTPDLPIIRMSWVQIPQGTFCDWYLHTWILWVDLKKVHNVCWIEYLNLPFERNVMMTFCKIFTLDFYALKIVVSYQATHPSCIFFPNVPWLFFFKIKLNFPCKNFVRHHSSLKAFDISEKIENDFNNPT